jgi:2-hydroxychromene-2-carboxylate isomerase
MGDMGELIYLSERAADRSRSSGESAAVYLALDCPLSYLLAERVERELGALEWVPVISAFGERSMLQPDARRAAAANQSLHLAESLAVDLGLPLVRPQRYPMQSRAASRVAVFAGEIGGSDCARVYELAILRLAFCGGYDINDRQVIVDAAAAAGIGAATAKRVAREPRFDLQLDATTHGLVRRQAPAPPLIRIGDRWFGGIDPIISVSA